MNNPLPALREGLPFLSRVIITKALPTVPHPPPELSQRQGLASRALRLEYALVGVLLCFAFLARLYAAQHTALEVDEPIYRDIAARLLLYHEPTLRPAYLHPVTPFLYQPPFFFFLLAGWFKLWGTTSYLCARMLSVVLSCLLLLLLYLLVRRQAGRMVAFIALVLTGCDPWLIFTNQAIYIENSLMLLVIPTIWAYWHAIRISSRTSWHTLRWYALTGLLAGCVIIYKQLGGFIVLVFFLNLLLERKSWSAHFILATLMILVVEAYVSSMHLLFGHAFDAATLDQFSRTLGLKAAPGLNPGLSTVLQATVSRYWMFFVTILLFLGGSALTVVRYIQGLLGLRNISQPLLVSWALAGLIFALGISLKDPHYMILWLVPVYLVLAQELGSFIRRWNWLIVFPWAKPAGARALSFLLLFWLFFAVGNALGFQHRFVDPHSDVLQQAEQYINETLPPDAVILTQNYIGVDLLPPFLDITLIATPQLIASHHVSYVALYTSTSEPIPPTLGPVNRYCLTMKDFFGFKDSIRVCQINLVALSNLIRVPPRR